MFGVFEFIERGSRSEWESTVIGALVKLYDCSVRNHMEQNI